ncbi:hypothetical protein [Streptosporangium sp. NPDC000396]|uniref:hypothetical protein n=1 Tax=Streptosporangium sp. NPDC000396 TaxID=3366185 RepID=UPI003682CACB
MPDDGSKRSGSPAQYFRSLPKDEAAATRLVHLLPEKDEAAAAFLPVHFSFYHAEAPNDYEWYLRWLAANIEEFDAKHPAYVRFHAFPHTSPRSHIQRVRILHQWINFLQLSIMSKLSRDRWSSIRRLRGDTLSDLRPTLCL